MNKVNSPENSGYYNWEAMLLLTTIFLHALLSSCNPAPKEEPVATREQLVTTAHQVFLQNPAVLDEYIGKCINSSIRLSTPGQIEQNEGTGTIVKSFQVINKQGETHWVIEYDTAEHVLQRMLVRQLDNYWHLTTRDQLTPNKPYSAQDYYQYIYSTDIKDELPKTDNDHVFVSVMGSTPATYPYGIFPLGPENLKPWSQVEKNEPITTLGYPDIVKSEFQFGLHHMVDEKTISGLSNIYWRTFHLITMTNDSTVLASSPIISGFSGGPGLTADCNHVGVVSNTSDSDIQSFQMENNPDDIQDQFAKHDQATLNALSRLGYTPIP